MKSKIAANDCKSMFNDKFNNLSMKELGIELKHFSVGTAPESPSHLVNQDELKKQIIDKFNNFFDDSKAQGLEVIFLKSNYGNGKSHFIRTIYTFLNSYENVLAKNVSLKQEETDLKKKVLEGVGQKVIKDCATYLVNASVADSIADEKSAILQTLVDKYSINVILAELIYEAARSNDISRQTQAIAILKGNYLSTYMKTFGLKTQALNSEFYFDVIKLVCLYLKEINWYMVIVFDEYEHVYSWKSAKARKDLYQDIKLFTDNLSTYSNLFFVFAESDSVDISAENSDDPAFDSRKKSFTYQIADISSESEIIKLFGMIRNRYEKYYELSFEPYIEEIMKEINEDPQLITNSNYRIYTQVIMKVLDKYRNKPPKIKKSKSINTKNNLIDKTEESSEKIELKTIESKWKVAKSISKKTMLCDAFEFIINHSNEKILSRSKKRGEYITSSLDGNVFYCIVATENPNRNDFTKRYDKIIEEKDANEINSICMIYPMLNGVVDENEFDKFIFYNTDDIPEALAKIYSNENTIVNVYKYLSSVELG